MAEYHFPVPGHEIEGEKIIIFTHKHWAAFLGPIILGFFLLLMPIIALPILAVNSDVFSTAWRNVIILSTSIYYLLIVNIALIEWISFYYDIVIVTERKIIDIFQNGIFDRSISVLPILRIQNTTGEIKGFLPTLFSYGDVRAETAGEDSQTISLSSIPNPVEVASKIMELQEKLIAEEQREKESLEGEGVLKSKMATVSQVQEKLKPPQSSAPAEEKEESEEGKIDKEQLEKGGEIKL